MPVPRVLLSRIIIKTSVSYLCLWKMGRHNKNLLSRLFLFSRSPWTGWLMALRIVIHTFSRQTWMEQAEATNSWLTGKGRPLPVTSPFSNNTRPCSGRDGAERFRWQELIKLFHQQEKLLRDLLTWINLHKIHSPWLISFSAVMKVGATQ